MRLSLSLSPSRIPSIPSAIGSIRKRRGKSSDERNRAAIAKLAVVKSHLYLQEHHDFDFGAPRPAPVLRKPAAAKKVGQFTYHKRDTGPTYCGSDDEDDDDDSSYDGSISSDSDSSASTPRARTRTQDIVSRPTVQVPERGRLAHQNQYQARSRTPSPEAEIWVACPKQKNNEDCNDSLLTFDDDWSFYPVASTEKESEEANKEEGTMDGSCTTEATIPLDDSMLSSQDGMASGNNHRRCSMTSLMNGTDPREFYQYQHCDINKERPEPASNEHGVSFTNTPSGEDPEVPHTDDVTPDCSQYCTTRRRKDSLKTRKKKASKTRTEEVNISDWRRRTSMILQKYDSSLLPDPFDSVKSSVMEDDRRDYDSTEKPGKIQPSMIA